MSTEHVHEIPRGLPPAEALNTGGGIKISQFSTTNWLSINQSK